MLSEEAKNTLKLTGKIVVMYIVVLSLTYIIIG